MAPDGSWAELQVETESGKSHTLRISYPHLRWLADTAIAGTNAMYDRQVTSGVLAGVELPDGPTVTDFTIPSSRADRSAALQMKGSRHANAPDEIVTVYLRDASLMRSLSARLAQVADDLDRSTN